MLTGFLDAKFQITPPMWWGIGTAIAVITSKVMCQIFLTKNKAFRYFETKGRADERHKDIKDDLKVIAADIKEILKNGK